jgi:16S rRNA (guanine(966)-N(2))-methyltransferase RsmD
MRVIAGSQKGRRLMRPRGDDLRPTSDRVKEALFSILGAHTTGARFLDLFAGTGAIGIEALSRGARSVTSIEPNPASLRVLRANVDRCGMADVVEIHACTVEAFLRRRHPRDQAYDIVFADPPYHDNSAMKLLPSLDQAGIMTLDSTVVLEHFTKVPVPPEVGRLVRLRQYRYGDTTLSVFGVRAEGEYSP